MRAAECAFRGQEPVGIVEQVLQASTAGGLNPVSHTLAVVPPVFKHLYSAFLKIMFITSLVQSPVRPAYEQQGV
ncbi:MAG: hypothetical protein QW797_00500 [Thermoproteota archaeon]